MYKVYAITDIGKEREENQDGFFIDGSFCCDSKHREVYYETDADYIHVAVCDGVGSTVYSKFAVENALSYLAAHQGIRSEIEIEKTVLEMNSYVYEEAQKQGKEDCATTVAGLVIFHDVAFVYNIGDSVVYSLNNGYLEKHSVDDAGIEAIDKNEYFGERDSDSKPPLLQSIGTRKMLDIVHIKKVINEDTFILSSDGVMDMLGLDEVERIIGESDSLKEISQNLINESNQNGGFDNLTAIILVNEKED